jgi:hypothetical protein
MVRPSWGHFAEDQVVGYIRLSSAARTATPWMWTLAYGQYEDRAPSHGYEATREAAIQAPGMGPGPPRFMLRPTDYTLARHGAGGAHETSP